MLAVNVVCRNYADDRVIPRFSRYLADNLGWTLTAKPEPKHNVYYMSGYFEWPLMKKARLTDRPMAAYLTHREEQPPNNAKAKLFNDVAQRVGLRIVTASMYAADVVGNVPTAQISPPVERGRFTIGKRPKHFTAGFSGFTYGNGRKGEDMARQLTRACPNVNWQASGRGWPCPTRLYSWKEMPQFYQSLDVLIITATVEGVPMPPLEAMACGVSVVMPRGVGLLDELPHTPGLHRYERGNATDMQRAFAEAMAMRGDVDRQAIRDATRPFTITAWCEQHRAAFNEVFG